MLQPGEEYHDLATLVRAKARKNRDRPALRFPSGDLSYADLDRESSRVARALHRSGLRRGETFACLLFNGPAFVHLWFGLAKLGAVLVPLNTALKGELLRYELADSGAKGLVLDARLWDAYAPLRASLGIERAWVVPAPEGEGGEGGGSAEAAGLPSWRALEELGAEPLAEVDEAPAPKGWEPASILYTSGTTGPPKGAIIPHQKYISTPIEIGHRSELAPGSVLFTELPLFHCNAQEMTTLTALLHDLTAAYGERFRASSYWQTAARAGATHVSLLISMINVLFKQPESESDRAHRVRVALTAGATKEVWPQFERRFGLRIVELYGMTECGCTTLMNPPGAVRVGSIGTPLGFVQAQVVDDLDRPVPHGTRGELVVRPRQPFTMFLGYHNQPAKTVEAWRNLWFHTGDFVTEDADGYFYFIDRKKDVIRRRGENLAPYDVETALNRHPAVFESVVVGVPSPLGEEDVKAFVQLKPGAQVEAKSLFEWCARELPFFMVPRFLEFVDEIPKTANQKAQRFLLRQRPPGPGQVDRESLGMRLKPP